MFAHFCTLPRIQVLKLPIFRGRFLNSRLSNFFLFFPLTPTSTSDCCPISGLRHWGVGVFWDRSRRLRWLTIMTVFQNWTLCFFAYQLTVTGFTQVWRSNVALTPCLLNTRHHFTKATTFSFSEKIPKHVCCWKNFRAGPPRIRSVQTPVMTM